ncbi:MAG: ABC transporter ATP-binding protein/permease [Clostridiales Family XIII bacterium]|jgi:ABC-type lipoprotein export system ATPase subunit|nr:ABC transporter ATP-binding protein/permease [Clostridiales Family XIII bacterium]
MLQLNKIRKSYTTEDFTQVALDDVSIALRDNEFVAILGPSGSGKTTLLNIVGGLDHYDSGDLVIDGVSTKQYKDRDWDAYRNNRIGFVFQSYNLIPHQTVLANVELALTLSGVAKSTRRQRAKDALSQVGLADHIRKRPSQLSGGQMQRVAIARALINDPEILLADEPTGALDSKTSVQIMGLLSEIARDRLVIMVTHNPELAEEYATRIINLSDGSVVDDSNPFLPDLEEMVTSKKPIRKTIMSFFTALALSFNNLMTKKGRTFMTAFAGSIGIIGIAAILALANGVNDYIKHVEEDTLSVYPLSIESTGIDITSMMAASTGADDSTKTSKKSNTNNENRVEERSTDDADPITAPVHERKILTSMFSRIGSNDLAALKTFLDGDEHNLKPYVNSIQYAYNVTPQIYSADTQNGVRQVNPDTSFTSLGLGGGGANGMSSLMSMGLSTDVFHEMIDDPDMLDEQFDIVAGRWPKSYNECILVLSESGGASDLLLYAMGLRNPAELKNMVKSLANEEDVATPEEVLTFSYEEMMDVRFKLVNATDYYKFDETYNVWTDMSSDQNYMKNLVANGVDIRITGVVKPNPDASAVMLSPGLYYPASLTHYLMNAAAQAKIVQSQLDNSDVNVFTSKTFEQEASESGMSNFDMGSLIDIDESAIQAAFNLDPAAMNMDLSNLIDPSSLADMTDAQLGLLGDVNMLGDSGQGGMNAGIPNLQLPTLDNLEFDMPDLSDLSNSLEMPTLDLASILSSIDVDISSDQAASLMSKILSDYLAAAFADGTVDPDAISAGFSDYLNSPEVQAQLQAPTDDYVKLLTEVMTDYLEQALENGVTDPNQIALGIGDYLNTPEIQQKLGAPSAQMVNLIGNLLTTYLQTTLVDELDPAAIAQGFSDYLSKPEVQSQLADAVNSTVDIPALQNQIQTQIQSQLQNQLQSALQTNLQDGVQTALQSTLQNQLQPVIQTALQSYMQEVMQTYLTTIMNNMQTQMAYAMQSAMSQLMTNMSGAMDIDKDAFAEAFSFNMDENELSQLMMSFLGSEESSKDNNLRKLGYANPEKPSSISIYPVDFKGKEHVIEVLDGYNERMVDEGKDDRVITYTDIVGTLMTSVTDIIDKITAVLVAFVAISLVVSSIMIGVITYISVLERKKEIGILRSIGASKRDISNVFNAETLIIGFVAGMLGITFTALATIPTNAIVYEKFDVANIAILPWNAAVILVIVSMALTFLAGLIPSSAASRKDPVEALRSE